MPVAKLKEFLDANAVKYVSISHSRAFTAMEVAESAHVQGKEMAKAVMLRLDGQMAMAVLPANQKVNLDLLRKGTGATSLELAHEQDFRSDFPGCEVGAMPPFGNLYGMKVFVEPRLAADRVIAFNAGSHTELIQMAYKDFERLVKPTLVPM
ncbi:MAG TPA: YbaK/EbsC family protein [Holophaga sp.]|nr:YbaK/EbsC family protein [Holophaga sp.]HPS68717.1 YbaK/EbsC family protein [Holophaga sp.]